MSCGCHKKTEKTIPIHFDHGGGDCVHFAHLLQVYKEYGFHAKVHYEQNKKPIWEAAGIPYAEHGPYHSWDYHPGFNHPLPDVEQSGNKVFQNINKYPLPDIATPEEIWEKVCKVNLEGTIDPQVTPQIIKEVDAFTKDLPKPIILLHSHGTNMSSLKSLPNETTSELYRLLLKGMEGTLILCDWDKRVPLLAHARVRHLCFDWSSETPWYHVDLLRFYELIKRAALLIGVDSCPYHFTSFTKTPALGVFYHHYPSCVALPREKNVNMTRNADSYRPVNQNRRSRWNIVEYPGTYPLPEEIAKHAFRMLEGPRYGLPIGRDVMMQQWIRDWCLTSTSTSPLADRNKTLDFLFREINKRFASPTIVETGCMRSWEDWSAGNSTYLFSAYLDNKKGKLISVDLNQNNCNFVKNRITWKADMDVVCSDSVKWLANCKEKIDVLYLDSKDCEEPGHAEHALAEIQAIEHKLPEESLVVFDDTSWNKGWTGKGATAVPFLLAQGWKILSSGYQVVLSRQNAV